MPNGHIVKDIEALDLADLRHLSASTRLIRFDRTTEGEFRGQYQETMVPVLRHALALAAILVAMITALDWFLMPQAFAMKTTALRCGIMLPAIGAVLAMTYVPQLHRYLTAMALTLALVVGGSVLAVGALANVYETGSLFSGMIVVIIYGYLFFGMRVIWATCAGVPLMLAHTILQVVYGAPPAVVAYSALFLTFANLVGAAGCYLLEMLGRRIFLENRLLRHLAGRDGLTRISNRRAFDEQLARIWTRAAEQGRRMGVVLVDVDRFKEFNDRYGHQAGDECLSQLAETLVCSARRPGDFVARYGGEEFAILTYDPPRDYLAKLAERIHANVCILAIPHDAGGLGGRVTVSIGTSMLRPCLDWNPVDAVGTADEALYRAKLDGRNRTVCHNTDAALEQTHVIRQLCSVS